VPDLLAVPVQAPNAAPTPVEIENEVLENVKHQPLGDGTVEDLALPDDFLRRVADRIVRASYEERYRIVVRDPVSIAARPSLAVLAAGALLLLAVGWALYARLRQRRAG
jgi:hypothetical protein